MIKKIWLLVKRWLDLSHSKPWEKGDKK